MTKINGETEKKKADALEQIDLFKKVLLSPNKDPHDYYQTLPGKVFTFLDWYISFSTSILNGKGYSDKRISEILLKDEFNSKTEEKEFLLKHFLISKDYVEYLKRVVTLVNIRRYFDKLLALTTELTWLVSQYEMYVTKSASGIQVGIMRTDITDPSDFMVSLNNLFSLEDLNDVDELYLGDVTPAIMFQIRQLLAIYGKKIMCYLDITDKDGNSLDGFTQVSWDFIKEEVKRPDPRISFPLFDLQTYMNINSWAGRFINNTCMYNTYIQSWVFKLIHTLFATGSLTERQKHKKYLLADIKISDYNAFRLDFELYLSSRMPDVKVKWDSIKNVGPLITSK